MEPASPCWVKSLSPSGKNALGEAFPPCFPNDEECWWRAARGLHGQEDEMESDVFYLHPYGQSSPSTSTLLGDFFLLPLSTEKGFVGKKRKKKEKITPKQPQNEEEWGREQAKPHLPGCFQRKEQSVQGEDT